MLFEAATANPAGESRAKVLRLDSRRRLMVKFRGPGATSGAGLLADRELDGAVGLTAMAAEMLAAPGQLRPAMAQSEPRTTPSVGLR
ncbi:MAG: hypothetical protein ACRECP_06640 [Methylocella sp.]